MPASPGRSPNVGRPLLWLVGLTLFVGALYVAAAGSWGFWEPWETEYARVGRTLAIDQERAALQAEVADRDQVEGLVVDFINPYSVGNRPQPINKPWLTTSLLELGYELDEGSELGMRLPFAALALICVLFVFVTLRNIVGDNRAGLSAVILATSPLFMLGAVNLAGAIPLIATTTMALCAFAMALCRRGSPIWMLLGGVFTGFAVWAGGLVGFAIVVGTLAGLGIWSLVQERDRSGLTAAQQRGLWIGGGLLATGAAVVFAFLWNYRAGRVDLNPGLKLGGPINWLTTWFQDTFTDPRDVAGLVAVLGLLVVTLAVGSLSRAFRRVGVLGWLLAAVAVVGVVAWPLWELTGQRTPADVVAFLLHDDFLNQFREGDDFTFDTIVRQVGFSAYPYTILLPVAFAYLIQTFGAARREGAESQATSGSPGTPVSPTAALKALLVVWFSVSFVAVTLGGTMTGHHIFTGMLPITAGIGLAMTDRDFWARLSRNRTALYLLGLISMVALAVLLKDLKTNQNIQLGQIGPEVLFEPLLLDGAEEFPPTFRLPYVRIFSVLWGLSIAFFFWQLANPKTYPKLSRVPVLGDALRAVLWVATPIRRLFGSPLRFAGVVVVTSVLFAGVTAFRYAPLLSNNLSSAGLIESYRARAQPGEVFYRVGSSRAAANYYLTDDALELPSGEYNEIRSLGRVSQLREYFCNPTERMFALIDRDALPQAYYEVRRSSTTRERRELGSCDPDRDLWVINGNSSRYVLVSNQPGPRWELPGPPPPAFEFLEQVVEASLLRGNPIARAVVDELPDDLIRLDQTYTFDGKLELLGYRVTNRDGEPLAEAGSGDVIYLETYFEVVERATSPRKIFIHMDFGSNRINGDHDPVNGEYPINYWVPGEIVRDRFPLKIDRGSPAGNYAIFFGFFSGDTRMDVQPPVQADRVLLGYFPVTGGI